LTDIAKGKGSKEQFISGIRQSTRDMVRGVQTDEAEYKATNITKSKCPSSVEQKVA